MRQIWIGIDFGNAAVRQYLVPFAVLSLEIESEENNSNGHSGIAGKMDAKCNMVLRRVPFEEDLRTCPMGSLSVTVHEGRKEERREQGRQLTDCVSCSPGHERCCYHCRLLGLPGNVARDQGQAQSLSRPEGKCDVVADEQSDFGARVVVFDSHQDDGSDEGS